MMNRRDTFADSFWGTDFQSTAGYDVLKRHIKEGKQTCVAFEQFLKLRAKAEEDYGKSLQKACKVSPETQEIGTLRTAWDYLKEQNERIAQMHLEASAQLSDAAGRLSEFIRRQKSERTPRENSLCQNAKEKSSLYRKTCELKRSYETKSSESEQADNVLKKAKPNENSYPTKEWDKIVQKQVKSIQDAKRADAQYRDSVARLEQTRQQWERDMTQFCDLCEALEDARIKMLQNEMWICCNILSSNCVEEDQCCESARNALEKVSIEHDIQSFINRSRTGTERPAPLMFEQYQPLHSATRLSSSSQGDVQMDHGRPHLPLPSGQGPAHLFNRNHNR